MLQLITPVILTYNEAPNIGRCLDGLSWARDIIVVDSFSDDRTLSIISSYPQVRCFQREFDNHASQWTFAVKETGITTEWVLAVDADYCLPEDFVAELEGLAPDSTVTGYQARFNYCISGRVLRSGVYPPVTVLYRKDRAAYEQDGHTQRLMIAGHIERLTTRLAHDDRKPLSRWLESQRKYALLEANKIVGADAEKLNLADRIRRLRVIAPLSVLIYCLILKGGLFDGWAGMYYALQRAFSELLLSLYLLEHDLWSRRRLNHQKVDSRSYAEPLKSDHVDLA
jgi:glycosyltransferase involved in cell wall biosynthesis